MNKAEAIAKIAAVKLLGQDIHVHEIVNIYGNVDKKSLAGKECFVWIPRNAPDDQNLMEQAALELQLPYAVYREGWTPKRIRGAYRPIFNGIVVRLDHARHIKRYLKRRRLRQPDLITA